MNSQAALMAQKAAGAQQQQATAAANKDKQIFDSALARAGEKATVLQTEHALLLDHSEPLGVETAG
jgi:hypothetical protein